MRLFRLAILLVSVLAGIPVLAATYYVDWVNGSDSNNGTSKSTPWQHAPGMYGVSGNANMNPAPGDSVIFKGGVVWPNAALPFRPPSSGSGSTSTYGCGGPGCIYYGVDQSWYETTGCQQVLGVTITSPGSGYTVDPVSVTFAGGGGSGAGGYALRNASGGIASVVMTNRGTGYSSAPTPVFSGGGSGAAGVVTTNTGWCRPVLDAQGQGVDRGYHVQIVIDLRSTNYIVLDNLEVKGVADIPDTTSGSNQVNVVHFGTNSNHSEVRNSYFHGWVVPYFSIGTGSWTAGSCSLTFTPATYSPVPQSAWVSIGGGLKLQSLPQGASGGIPQGNNTPAVTSITDNGNGTYTVAYTNNTGCPATSRSNAPVQMGSDSLSFFTGIAAVPGYQNVGTLIDRNVIDGSDTAIVQYNPYADCGLAEGNNHICLSSGTAVWQGPQYVFDNVFRYIMSGAVGNTSEVHGNLIENLRLGPDPTSHTNFWENNQDSPNGFVFYNNVGRHLTNPNPYTPTGVQGTGMIIQMAALNGKISAVFNNVMYDLSSSTSIGGLPVANPNGSYYVFNNSVACGYEGSYTTPCIQACPVGATSCLIGNNYLITSSSLAISGCTGGVCSATDNIIQTSSTAALQGYSELNLYPLTSSNSSGATVKAGANLLSDCSGISGAGFNAAGTACQSDTTFGPAYDTLHQASSPGQRAALARPASGAWDVGAYQFQISSGVLPATGLSAVAY